MVDAKKQDGSEWTPLERVVFWSVALTYPLWLIGGGQYLWGSVLGWLLLAALLWRMWQGKPVRIPWSMWLWIGGMLLLLVTLFVSHIDFNRTTAALIRSLVSWGRTWGLLALYPLAGCLGIRPQPIYRGAMIVCGCTLLAVPPLYLLKMIGFREIWYTSPLRVLGGPNALPFFQVGAYGAEDGGRGQIRWQLFAPWAPALGLIAIFFFFFALQERGRWRWVGIAGSLLMIGLSGSRLTLLCLPLAWFASWLATQWRQVWVMVGLGAISSAAGILSDSIAAAFQEFYGDFRAARPGSSQVREDLQEIALYRWQNAPLWGHGATERGPITVAYMPIGSHHTWNGVLFVNGLVGLVGILVPLAATALHALYKAQFSETGRVGLQIALTLCMFSFGENLEATAFFYWPALLVLGTALAQPNPPHWPGSLEPREAVR